MEGLSDALRYLRIFHDLDQREAAPAIGISAPYLSQLESGKKGPTVDVLAKYGKFFDVPVSSILILAERLENGDFSHNGVESLVSSKILRILSWLQEIERKPKTTVSTNAPRKRRRKPLSARKEWRGS